MNKTISKMCRITLQEMLRLCTEEQQLFFKRMYSPSNLELPINEVVDQMEDEKLDWAISQCESTLRKNGINVIDTDNEEKNKRIRSMTEDERTEYLEINAYELNCYPLSTNEYPTILFILVNIHGCLASYLLETLYEA